MPRVPNIAIGVATVLEAIWGLPAPRVPAPFTGDASPIGCPPGRTPSHYQTTTEVLPRRLPLHGNEQMGSYDPLRVLRRSGEWALSIDNLKDPVSMLQLVLTCGIMLLLRAGMSGTLPAHR